MARQKLLQISVVILLLATASAQASSLSISIGGRGIHFSASSRPVLRPHARHIRPYHGIVAPQPRIVIARPSIVVPRGRGYERRRAPLRPVYHPIVKPCVRPGIVTVWITNSNGSEQPVVLTKTQRGYKGPRGEYYSVFPSNRQLRGAYGF